MARRPLQLNARPAGRLAAGLALGITVAACSPSPGHTPAVSVSPTVQNTATTAASPGTADQGVATPPVSDPAVDQVAISAVRAWLSWDTRIDSRPAATTRRLALGWLCPAMRAQVQGAGPIAPPDTEWQDWVAHKAHAKVTTVLGSDEHPGDTALIAWRQATSTIALTGKGKWSATTTRTDWLQLSHTTGTWCVQSVRETTP